MSAKTVLILGLATAMAGCTSIADVPTERVGETQLRFANGLPAGTAQLLRGANQISLSVSVSGMEPGAHGFHLHAVGRCEGPDFTSAEGHLNPYGKNHGSLSAGGSHLGDLPNLTVAANGTATADVVIGGDRETVLEQIFDKDGTAIIVHAKADDYRTNPSGDAGARVACGVMRES